MARSQDARRGRGLTPGLMVSCMTRHDAGLCPEVSGLAVHPAPVTHVSALVHASGVPACEGTNIPTFTTVLHHEAGCLDHGTGGAAQPRRSSCVHPSSPAPLARCSFSPRSAQPRMPTAA